MKVLFFCGSIEPGRDGVGDYTRRLAGELARRGAACRIVSIADRCATSGGFPAADTQDADGTPVSVCRLGRMLAWDQRRDAIRQFVQSWEPDHLCLQFVPYSFNPRGLPTRLARLLDSCGARGRWSVMFHELNIGYNVGAAWKERLIGAMQRAIIKNLVRVLRPVAVFTQSDTYRVMLRRWNIQATRLPLFGNLQSLRGSTDQNAEAITSADGSLSVLRGVMFGSFAPAWEPQRFVKALAKAGVLSAHTLEIVHCGIASSSFEAIRKAADDSRGRIMLQVLGQRSSQEISRILFSANFGIATTPSILLQKSGGVAAMIEHGLPVLNAGFEYRPRWNPFFMPELDAFERERIVFMEDASFAALTRRWQPCSRLSATADAFEKHIACDE